MLLRWMVMMVFFFFLITVGVRASLRAPRLIPWGLEVNGKVTPLVALRGLELVTIGEQTQGRTN